MSITFQENLISRPKSVRDVIEELHAMWQKKRSAAEVPSVTLHLISGRTVSGWLVEAGNANAGGPIYLQQANSRGEATMSSILCTDFSKIEAITLNRPPRPSNSPPRSSSAKLVEFDNGSSQIVQAPKAPAATKRPVAKLPPQGVLEGPAAEQVKAQLTRHFIAMESKVGILLDTSVKIDVSWRTIPMRQEALLALKQVAQLILSSVTAMAAGSSYRKDECRTIFQSVRIEHASQPKMQYELGTLVISVPVAEGKLGYSSLDAFKAAVEELISQR